MDFNRLRLVSADEGSDECLCKIEEGQEENQNQLRPKETTVNVVSF